MKNYIVDYLLQSVLSGGKDPNVSEPLPPIDNTDPTTAPGNPVSVLTGQQVFADIGGNPDPISTSIDMEMDYLNAEPLGDVLDDFSLTNENQPVGSPTNTDADNVNTINGNINTVNTAPQQSKPKWLVLLLLLLICKK